MGQPAYTWHFGMAEAQLAKVLVSDSRFAMIATVQQVPEGTEQAGNSSGLHAACRHSSIMLKVHAFLSYSSRSSATHMVLWK